MQWSAALGSTGPASPTDRSLTITHRKICWLGDAGVVCVSKDHSAIDVRSTWPRSERRAVDRRPRRPRLCAADATTIACTDR
jgi:hypothetical protein